MKTPKKELTEVEGLMKKLDTTLEFAEEMKLLSGKIENLNSRERVGAISHDEASIERSKIMIALSELKKQHRLNK